MRAKPAEANDRAAQAELSRLEKVLARIQNFAQAGDVASVVRLADRTLAKTAGLTSPEALVLRARFQLQLAPSLVVRHKVK